MIFCQILNTFCFTHTVHRYIYPIIQEDIRYYGLIVAAFSWRSVLEMSWGCRKLAENEESGGG